MTSPRSGFRRAAVASWTLAGIGVAGVAGASALAYAETYKPPAAEVPVDAVAPAAPVELPPAPPVVLPPPPAADTPAPAPEPVATQAPVQQTYVPQQQTYTPPKQTYVAPVQQAPIQQAPAPKSTSSFPIRQSHVPSGGGQVRGGNSFSPHVTVSRGS